jgi:ubiquinone/menaquinone biosynthesis C-methylase UbiE
MTDETDIEHPRFARFYLRGADRVEKRGATAHRRKLLDGLSGTVLELGAGSGLNFPLYPAGVSDVLAIEPEPTLRSAAMKAGLSAPVRVRVIPGIADRLPVQDESFDAAVASLVLCSVPDQDVALRELRRVLRPGGELRFYEHVIAESGPKRILLKALDGSGLWPKLAGGCHPARDTGAAIERAGFQIVRSERIMFASSALEPTIPYIIGSAVRTS